MNKIYVFNNGGSLGWYKAVAIAESGHVIASHVCSSEGFMYGDMGLTSDWKHDNYKEHYPDGYELEWIPTEQLKTHEGLRAALAKNDALAEQEKTKNQPSVEISFSDGTVATA